MTIIQLILSDTQTPSTVISFSKAYISLVQSATALTSLLLFGLRRLRSQNLGFERVLLLIVRYYQPFLDYFYLETPLLCMTYSNNLFMFYPLAADTSKNLHCFESANAYPSSLLTSRFDYRSSLFPTSTLNTWGLEQNYSGLADEYRIGDTTFI